MRFRFSIRTLLYVTFVLVMALLVCVQSYQRISETKDFAAEQIRAVDGTIDFRTVKSGMIVSNIDLRETEVHNRHMKYVRTLDPVGILDLTDTKISDRGLQLLHGIQVREIKLTGTKVTEPAVAKLKSTMDRTARITRQRHSSPTVEEVLASIRAGKMSANK